MTLAPADNKPPLLFLLLLLFSVTCSYGNQNQQFINSCGDIHNISFPFQLQGDPSNPCNDSFYTLSCDENNRTVLPLLSGKYYVQSINYTDYSIRLVDVGIQTNNICSSFPLSSFNGSDFDPMGFIDYSSRSSVLFLSCEKPVQSPTYINRTRYCNTRDESGNEYYSYVVAGRDVRVWDIADSCLSEVSYISTSRAISERGSNLSWLDLNKELGYGFDFLWGDYSFFCRDLSRCRERASCFGDSVNVTAVCNEHEYCQYNGNLWWRILSVARGVGYLHQGCDMQILHFDIKPHNILLDENFTPKVSDFGLAKLYPTDENTITMTAARGTLGYMAPELFYKNIGGVSYKADIYSFGMLLMELASRRRNWNSSANSSQVFFPSWVYDQFAEGKNLQIGETTKEESEMVKKMMLVALWCIQMRPSDRPSMNKVVEMLEGNLELLHTPSKPFLYSQAMPAENNGMNIMLPNLSGACSDAMTSEITGR